MELGRLLSEHAVLSRMLRWFRRTPSNPLADAVHSTMPSPDLMGMGEAEMDRYTKYHTSNQFGR